MAEKPARFLFQYVPGEPAGFYLDPSIKNPFQRETLTDDIVNNGGEVLDEPSGADTVLVDEKHLHGGSITSLQTAYAASRDAALRQIVVEPMKYIQICIRHQKFGHVMKERQAMGGYVGRTRTKFTNQDEDNLCWILSRKIPYAEHGGRLSTGVYKEIMVAANHDTTGILAWFKRHPVDSWLEHYKKNRGRFDPIIDRYVRESPPEPTAYYGLSRQCNKDPRKALKFIKPHDVIDITDSSAQESEEEPDVDVKPQRRGRSPKNTLRPSKRRRIETSAKSPLDDRSHVASSPKHKGKEKEPDRTSPEPDQDQGSKSGFSPEPEPFEPGPSQSRRLTRSPVAVRQADVNLTPAPSPTLVQRPSSAVRSPRPPLPPTSSIRRVNVAAPPSPRPSTSFRNVVHSSPAFAGPGSPSRSGVRSHNTSATEPSSRSLVVLSELAHPTTTASNAPAESSITRESSHKPSSPISQPMRKASRKLPSRQPTLPSSDEEEEGSQPRETQWAPYKNTRSHSSSVEPAPLRSKKRGKKGNGRQMPRNEVPLEPVHESEVEQEQDLEVVSDRIISTMTETMQDEQNVADLLRVNPDDAASGTLSGVSTGQGLGDEDNGSEENTEDEGEGVKRLVRRRKEEDEEETQEARDSEIDESIEDETAVAQSNGVEPEFEEEDLNDISSFSESEEGVTSPKDEEGNTLDISSDDEVTERRILSQTRSTRQRQIPLSSDDEQIDQMIGSPSTTQSTPAKTAKEVLELYGSSPGVGRSQQKQRKPFNNFRTGSPSPLKPQNQNRPRQSLPVTTPMQTRKPAQARPSLPPAARLLTKATPVHRAVQKLTGPHRVSFGGDGDELSSPSSIGSLPRTPVISNAQPVRGGSNSRARSSLRRSVPLSQPRSQSQSRSRHQARRRGSVESSSSELVTFPISGTRASEVKQQMEQDLKASPYTPPSGSKAALAIAARQRLRPRKRG